MKLNRYLIQINRLSVWILFALMIIFVVTGYSMAFHVVMRPSVARYPHSSLKELLVFFFLVHALISTKFTMMRVMNRWEAHHGRMVDISLLLLGIPASITILSVEYIYGFSHYCHKQISAR